MAGTRHSALAALSLIVFAALSAGAQENRTTRDVAALTGTVERIDTFSRSLTVKTTDGLTHSVYVGPELEVFSQLKSGDPVLVRVVESVIVALRPGAKTTALMDTTAAAKKSSEAAQGDVLQQLKAVVRIESVDMPMHVVTYVGADNRRVMRQVADPRLIEGLKAGDIIEITYTRERAIALQRQP